MEMITINPENWVDNVLDITLLSNNKFRVYDLECQLKNKKTLSDEDFDIVIYDCFIDGEKYFSVEKTTHKSKWWIKHFGEEDVWTASYCDRSRCDKLDARIACAKIIANFF